MIPKRPARPYDALDPRIPRVQRRIRKMRLSVCKECEHYTGLEQCALCGCFMPVKVMLPHSTCPAGKWGPEDDDTNEPEAA